MPNLTLKYIKYNLTYEGSRVTACPKTRGRSRPIVGRRWARLPTIFGGKIGQKFEKLKINSKNSTCWL